LVLVDDLHSRETFPGVRPRNGHRSGIEVENRERIQGVAIRPNSGDSLYLAPLRRNPDWIFVLFLIYTSVEELNARLGDGELMKIFFTRRSPVMKPTLPAADSRGSQAADGEPDRLRNNKDATSLCKF
jgi:hypothetical protein